MIAKKAILACCITLSPLTGAAQTLPEIARLHGGSANSMIDIDSPLSKPVDLFAQADLVVHGRVTSVNTRLNADQTIVITEYKVTPFKAFKERRTEGVPRPGMVEDIVVQRSGGNLVTPDGLHLSTTVNIFPDSEAFRVGEEVLLFLTYDADSRSYRFTSGEFGAYRLRNGMAMLMTANAAQRRNDPPLTSAALFAELTRMR